MERRDYLERLIEQCAAFLREIARLVQQGQLDPALLVVRQAEEVVAGPLKGMLERLEARSLVAIAGPVERERVRLYARLIAEEADLRERLGDPLSAELCRKRSAELLAALDEP